MSPLITFLVAACRKSSKTLLRDYFELEQIQNSPRTTLDFASKARKKATETLEKELSKYPNSIIITPTNEISDASKDLYFIIEALDDTKNLSRALPFFGMVVIACSYKNEILKPIATVIYLPAINEIIFASKGGGAWMERLMDQNSERALRLRVSSSKNLENENSITISNPIMDNIYGACLVASGKADIFIGDNCKDETIMAAELVIHEAGGSTFKNYIINGKAAKFVAVNNIKLLENN